MPASPLPIARCAALLNPDGHRGARAMATTRRLIAPRPSVVARLSIVVPADGVRGVRAREVSCGDASDDWGYGDRCRDLIGPSEARRLRRESKTVELIVGIPGSSAWQQRIVLMGSAGQ